MITCNCNVEMGKHVHAHIVSVTTRLQAKDTTLEGAMLQLRYIGHTLLMELCKCNHTFVLPTLNIPFRLK